MQENELVYVYFGPLTGSRALIPPKSPMSNLPIPPSSKRRIGRQPNAFTYWLRHYMRIIPPRLRALPSIAARSS